LRALDFLSHGQILGEGATSPSKSIAYYSLDLSRIYGFKWTSYPCNGVLVKEPLRASRISLKIKTLFKYIFKN
jgi:hypothetical protein